MPDADALPPLPEYAGNAFIERLPPIRSVVEVHNSFKRDPLHSKLDQRRPPEQRMHTVLRLLHYSQPTANSNELGVKIDQMLRQSYIGRSPATAERTRMVVACADVESKAKEAAKRKGEPFSEAVAARSSQTQAARRRRSPDVRPDEVLAELTPVRDTSLSSFAVGPPGMGKTHAVINSLDYYPQVIVHQVPVQVAQIVWLRVECPPDGSLVSMCRFFFAAVDQALNRAGFESELHNQYRNAPLGVLLTGMARVANLHAIGLLVIDEVQHVKVARNEGNALLNFLVTLRNVIGVSMLLVGTMSAMPVLQRTFRDARRGDGVGSVRFNRMAPAPPEDASQDGESGEDGAGVGRDGPRPIYGNEFLEFVTRMWRWQYTKDETELSVEVLNALYYETQGIIDLVVKLFTLCQMKLITTSGVRRENEEFITPELVHEVADRSFNVVRPFVRALRDNDVEALAKYEDLIDFSEWFQVQLASYATAELDVKFDADHGSAKLPPMVVDGAIDRLVVDQLLEGFGVAVKDRESMLSRHAKLVETGDLTGLVLAVRDELKILSEGGRLRTTPLKAAPPIEGDMRAALKGVTSAADVSDAVGAPSLADALA